ncbi:MAG: nucleotide-binding protein [Hadesarchaea archaeon]|nr:MAG: nucleotide-binding protein [Hadesarchaea archaeon]
MGLKYLKVIADTSFLMIPGTFGVDIISELNRLLERRYRLLIPAPVLKELEYLARKGTPSERSSARLGMVLAEQGEIVEGGEEADEAILRLAKKEGKEGCVVGTNDRLLQKKLEELGIPVVRLKHRSYLMLTKDLE